MGFATEFYQTNRYGARNGWEASETQHETRSTQPTHCRSPKSAITRKKIRFRALHLPTCKTGIKPCRKSNPPFFEPPRRLAPEKATKKRGKWWVGISTRLEGHGLQEMSNWRRFPDSNPPTLRPKHAVADCRRSKFRQKKTLKKKDDVHHLPRKSSYDASNPCASGALLDSGSPLRCSRNDGRLGPVAEKNLIIAP